MKGIDVSNSNGNIDWQKVKDSGIEFAIIRLGWGGDYTNQDDPNFNKNVSECERLGIPWGAYLYSYALTLDAVDGEIKHALRMLQGKKPTLGMWFDMEDADHYKQKHGINVYQNRRLITDMCKKFVDGTKWYGGGVYASWDYFKNVIYRNELTCDIWVACWGPSNPPTECKMWQYADNGRVNGISTNVDMDMLYSSEKPKPIIINKPTIIYGMRGEDVAEMQRLLISHGYSCGKTGADGIYGQNTKTALGAYQAEHPECGLVDYKCGPKTWASLLS